MTKNSYSVFFFVGALGLVLLLSGVYFSGLQGPFILDDEANILRPPAIAIKDLSVEHLRDAAFVQGKAYPARGLAHLSFALNYYFAGGDFNALAYKFTNLVIHLLNALLVWFIAHRLLSRFAVMRELGECIAGRPWWHWAALCSALIWALHPLQLTVVLYVVQRMTSLAALFCLLGLALWTMGRERLEKKQKHGLLLMVSGVGFGVLLGLLSKENAILLPFYVLITEWVFFRREVLQAPALRTVRVFFLLFAGLPALLAFGYILSHGDYFLTNYQVRNFTLVERLLTETRVLWYYLQLIFFPIIQNFGIYHDDFVLSKSLLTPPTTLIAILSWTITLAFAVAGLRKRWLFSFAVLWYLIGHSIESSFIALEPIFEHRNYLPLVGLSVAFSVYLLRGLVAVSSKSVLRLGVPALLILTISGITFTRANIWQFPYSLAYIGVKNHPNSSRYHREYASQLSINGGDEAEVFQQLQAAGRLDPGEITVLFEQARIISRRLIDAGIASNKAIDSNYAVDLFSDPLPEAIPALLAFEAAIDKEVRRRLRDEVPSTNSIEVGRYTQACINTGNLVCERMQANVAIWLKELSASRFASQLTRALSALAYAKIMAAQGEIQTAIESMDEAVRLMPNAPGLRFQKAILFLSLNRMDEADKIMDEARELLPWSGVGRRSYEQIRQLILEAHNEEKNSKIPHATSTD